MPAATLSIWRCMLSHGHRILTHGFTNSTENSWQTRFPETLETIADRSACIVSFSSRNMFCTAPVQLILRQSLCLTVNDDCSLLILRYEVIEYV